MSKKFVRNITDTELRGDNKEPLNTNIQNDILSDSEDVFIRNKDEYHCLTDNIKHITSDNGSIAIERKDKNTVDLRVLFGEGGEPLEVFITVKENSKEYLLVNEITPNHFEIGVTNNFITDYEVIKDIVQNLPEQYYSKEEINNIVKNLEEVDLSNYYTKEEIDNKFKTFNPIADVEIKSNSSRLHVLKKDSNDFQLDLDLSGFAMENDLNVNIESLDKSVLQVNKTSKNNFELVPDLSNYATKYYVDKATLGGMDDLALVVCTSIRFNKEDNSLKVGIYNNSNRPIRVLKLQVWCAFHRSFDDSGISGTDFKKIEKEFNSQISPGRESNILVMEPDSDFIKTVNKFIDNNLQFDMNVVADVYLDYAGSDQRLAKYSFTKGVIVYPIEQGV